MGFPEILINSQEKTSELFRTSKLLETFENLKKSRNENAPNNLIRQIEAKNLKTAVLDTRLA